MEDWENAPVWIREKSIKRESHGFGGEEAALVGKKGEMEMKKKRRGDEEEPVASFHCSLRAYLFMVQIDNRQ